MVWSACGVLGLLALECSSLGIRLRECLWFRGWRFAWWGLGFRVWLWVWVLFVAGPSA